MYTDFIVLVYNLSESIQAQARKPNRLLKKGFVFHCSLWCLCKRFCKLLLSVFATNFANFFVVSLQTFSSLQIFANSLCRINTCTRGGSYIKLKFVLKYSMITWNCQKVNHSKSALKPLPRLHNVPKVAYVWDILIFQAFGTS